MVAVESRIAPRPHFMLVALDVADLQECPEGLRITIRRSKTDQEGAGAVVAVQSPPSGTGSPPK
jgi:hypothetical protein